MDYLSDKIRSCPSLQQQFKSGSASVNNTGCGGYGYSQFLGGIMGSNVPVAKITQLIYMNDGLQIYSEAKSYSVSTNDVFKIREIIEFLNGQNAFKERKKQSREDNTYL